MTRINTNVSSLIAQKTLARSNTSLQQALTRLSTGLRINSGKDDPAGLIASEALRSDIVSTGKAISNTQRANQLIATADSALGQVAGLLNDIRGLITEAANKGALSQEQIAANQLQIDSSLEAINRIAQTTTFQGKKLLDGSLDFLTGTWTNQSRVEDMEILQANLGATGYMDVSMVVSTAAQKARVTTTINSGAAKAQVVLSFNDGGALTITAANNGEAYNGYVVSFQEVNGLGATNPQVIVNDNDKTITIYVDDTAATDLGDIATAFDQPWVPQFSATETTAGTYDPDNDDAVTGTTSGGASNGLAADLVIELSGAKGTQVLLFEQGASQTAVINAINLVSDATGVTAADGGSGLINIDSSDYGSNAFVRVNIISGSQTFTTVREYGTDIAATVNGVTASGKGNTLSINTPTLAMSATIQAGWTGTVSFRISGGGALFQLGPDVVSNQQARMGIRSISTASLGGTSGRLYQLASGQSAALATDATTAAEIVDQVLTKVTSLRGRLGAFQKASLDANIATLTDTMEALTDAESTIRDADFAQESAALTRAQILVQSGLSVLTIANTQPQNVLALLR